MSEFAQWETSCPNCGATELFVTRVTLTYQGEAELGIHAPLEEDGFDFWDELTEEQKGEDCSTQDEVVTCGNCGVEFTLAELSLGDQHSFRFEAEAHVEYGGAVFAPSQRIAEMKARRQLEKRVGASSATDFRFKWCVQSESPPALDTPPERTIEGGIA